MTDRKKIEREDKERNDATTPVFLFFLGLAMFGILLSFLGVSTTTKIVIEVVVGLVFCIGFLMRSRSQHRFKQ